MAKNKGNTSYKELQKKLNSTQKDGKNRAASLKDALDKSRNKKSGNKAVNNKNDGKNKKKQKKEKDWSVFINKGAGEKYQNRRKYIYNNIGNHVLYISEREAISMFSLAKNDEYETYNQATQVVSVPNVVTSEFPDRREPEPREINEARRHWLYNYSTANTKFNDYVDLDHVVEKLNKSVHLRYTANSEHYFKRSVRWYNRFKIPVVDSVLQRGFAHVFFVRPSCNIFKDDGYNLTDALLSLDTFTYIYNASPWVLRELTDMGGQDNDFMLSLSNAVQGFSLQDEVLDADTYGKTYTGYKIAFGRHNLESRTANNLTLTFRDDRNLHIYQIFKAWTEYISGVYRGYINPRTEDIFNKVLDYVGAIYYVVTAEDGETVLFWSKYYGVFPTSAPSTNLNWGSGNYVNPGPVDVTFSYSYKEDYNPFQILEFNYNARSEGNMDAGFAPTYDKIAGQMGVTWVGCPFIASNVRAAGGSLDHDTPFTFKLRYRPNDDTEDTAFTLANRMRNITNGLELKLDPRYKSIKYDTGYEKYKEPPKPKPIAKTKSKPSPVVHTPKSAASRGLGTNVQKVGNKYAVVENGYKHRGTTTYLQDEVVKDKPSDYDLGALVDKMVVNAIRATTTDEMSKSMQQIRTYFLKYKKDQMMVNGTYLTTTMIANLITNARREIKGKRQLGKTSSMYRNAEYLYNKAFTVKDLIYLANVYQEKPPNTLKPITTVERGQVSSYLTGDNHTSTTSYSGARPVVPNPPLNKSNKSAPPPVTPNDYGTNKGRNGFAVKN